MASRKIRAAALGALTVLIAFGIAVYSLSHSADLGKAGTLRVVAQGFSERPGGGSVTYAFVVQNRAGRQAVADAGYRVTFLSKSGEVVAERAGTIGSVFPASKVAIAENFVPAPAEVRQMKVVLVEGKNVRTELSGPSREGASPVLEAFGPEQVAIHTAIQNSLDVDVLSLRVVAVVRDESGRVIGGGSSVGQFILARESKDMDVVLFNRQTFDGGRAELYPLIEEPRLTEVVEAQAQFEARLRDRTPDVRWIPTALPGFTGAESTNPLGRERPARFQLWTAGVDEEPELLLDTHRLTFAEWLDRRSLLVWQLSREDALPGQAVRGISIYDAEDKSEVLPLRLIAGSYQAYASPDGRYVAISGQDSAAVLLLDRDGSLRSLEGLSDRVTFVGWSPDARWMLLRTPSLPRPTMPPGQAFLYVVPTEGGKAQLVPAPFRYETFPAWRPDSGAIAFVSDGDVQVYELTTGQVRRISDTGDYRYVWPRWYGSSYVAAGGDLYRVQPPAHLVRLLRPETSIGSAMSPDGRYFLAWEQPGFPSEASGPLCPYNGLRNRTRIYDMATGTVRVLLDCDRGFYVGFGANWLDERRLMVNSPPCWACEGGPGLASILDVETGAITPVNLADDPRASALVAPDGEHYLLTGGSLRLFDSQGRLVREYVPPEGTVVMSAAWSPDGRRVVFVLAPADLSLL